MNRQRQVDIAHDFAMSHRIAGTDGSLWESLLVDVLASDGDAVTVEAGRADIRLRTFEGRQATGWRPLLDARATTWQEVVAAKCGENQDRSPTVGD
jgi:hypothetical protein